MYGDCVYIELGYCEADSLLGLGREIESFGCHPEEDKNRFETLEHADEIIEALELGLKLVIKV